MYNIILDLKMVGLHFQRLFISRTFLVQTFRPLFPSTFLVHFFLRLQFFHGGGGELPNFHGGRARSPTPLKPTLLVICNVN